MSERLKDWEIETIDALAAERLERLEAKEFVQFPDRIRDGYIADVQRDVLADEAQRRKLVTHADRLGIGIAQPPRVSELPPLPTPDDTLASRWCRITLLKLRIPAEHEWSVLFADVVTRHVEAHRFTRNGWTPTDQGIGIIDLLEIEAERHGLIAGHAPELTARQVADVLVGAAS